MKTNIATDRSQSQRLLRCGVSADTADMCWLTILCPVTNKPWDDPRLSTLPYSEAKDFYGGDYVEPAWSLSALLTKALPHNISVDKYKYKGATEYEVGCYFTGHRDKIAFNASCPIEACVKLIEWLAENNYKLNE
jgi:hypothetical protein